MDTEKKLTYADVQSLMQHLPREKKHILLLVLQAASDDLSTLMNDERTTIAQLFTECIMYGGEKSYDN